MLCVVASSNRHKVAELVALLGDVRPDLEVCGTERWPDPPQIAETGDSFRANAELKALGVAAWLAGHGVPGESWVIADDSGLCVDLLGGAPGVISARWAGEACDDAANNRKLVAELQRRGFSSSPARYECVLAVGTVAGERVRHVRGTWMVEVRADARGTGGFGYDPHAWLDGGSRTVAELEPGEKNARSHRGAALRELARLLRMPVPGGLEPSSRVR